jgi:type I restriction enzyme S subunit
MRYGRIVEDPTCSVPFEVVKRLSPYQLNKGDLVFSRRGELGRCALVREREIGWFCGTGSIRVRVAYKELEPEYLIQSLQVRWVGEYLSLFSVGATMESLNTGILKGVPLVLPPVDEQRQLVERIALESQSIDRAVGNAEREIALVNEYRTRLIADIAIGKLDVREAAARLSDQVEEPQAIDEPEDFAEGDEEAEGSDFEVAMAEAGA